MCLFIGGECASVGDTDTRDLPSHHHCSSEHLLGSLQGAEQLYYGASPDSFEEEEM